MVDSAALFKSRCQATGLSDAAITAITAKGWGTMGTFAFCASNSPATVTDTAFADKVVVPILGDRDHVDAPKLRRLHFEACTTVSAKLKRRVDASEQDAPRKLPPQEISERLEALQKKILPLKVENALEPSHSLINHVAQFVKEGRLRYIEWSKCTTRTQEVSNLKEDQFLKIWKPDANGVIKAVDKGVDMRATVSTDLEVHNALRRRGVAYDVGQAMSFTKHEELINLFFNEMQKEPLDGFQRVSLEQIAAADREVHVRLAEKTRSGLSKGTDGGLPLDKPLEEVLQSSEVRWLLMPLPKRVQPKPTEPAKRKTEEESKASAKGSPKKAGNGKGGQNQGPRKIRKGPMPAGLRGGVPSNAEGKPICFAYNLGTCKSDHDCSKSSKEPKQSEDCAGVASSASTGLLRGCKRALEESQDSPTGSTSKDAASLFTLSSLPQAAKVCAVQGEGPASTLPHSQPQAAGASDTKPYFLAIFCGTAGVAASLKRHGAEALGVDHVIQKNRMKGPAVKMDLTLSSSQQLIEDEIRSGKVAGVMLAPPCGTSSKAGNIPLRNKHGRRVRGPPPLRSHQYPEGLPGLSGVSRKRVKQANILYEFCRRIMDICAELNILCIVENPESSFFWVTKFMHPKPESFEWHIVHACMYGSKRLKKTALLINFLAPNLTLKCDNSHEHLPWTHTVLVDPDTNRQVRRFDTASEAEYPKPFCDALAFAFTAELNKQGIFWDVTPALQDAAAYLANDKQPRGASSPIQIPEFKHTVQLTVPAACDLPEVIGADASPPFEGLPVGAKLISFQHIQERGSSDALKTAVYGVFHSPEEFLQVACTLRHPFNVPVSTDVDNIRAIAKILELGKLGVMKYIDWSRSRSTVTWPLLWNNKSGTCRLDCILMSDASWVQSVSFFLQQMMEDAGVVDENLFAELCNGFRLTGHLGASGQFRPRFKPAGMSVDELRRTSKWARHAIEGSCKRVAENPEVAAAVWDETVSQLDSGLDDAAAAAKYMLSVSTDSRDIWLPSPSGEFEHCGELHNTWSPHELSDVRGRAMDLKSAYKQLARDPADDWCSILAVWCPDEECVKYFESVALPFGAVSAVNAFNRVAKCLRVILCRLFLLVNTSFFDDYCQLEFTPLCDSIWKTAETVLKLLGWKIAMSEDKRKPFDKKFQMLGAIVDLSMSAEGAILISNKPNRLEELQAAVAELHVGKFFSETQLQSLRGRLLYAAGHTFGRCTQIAVQALGNMSRGGSGVTLDEEMLRNIRFAIDTLVNAPARVVRAWKDEWPILIFTDGACEENGTKVTHGAVLCDTTTHSFFFFGDDVPSEYVSEWVKFGKKTSDFPG
eukprot:s953_g5.t1